MLDLSAFAVFHFERTASFGFCPPLNAVFEATIRSAPAGRYELAMSLLARGADEVDDCLPIYYSTEQCYVVRELPTRDLTASEKDQVRNAFAAVPVFDGPDPQCEHIVVDACLVNRVTWDSVDANDHPCTSGSRIGSAQMTAIVRLLESLRGARDPCLVAGCNGDVCTRVVSSTSCEYPPYASYRTATCERQASGECGWSTCSEPISDSADF
jgi:hypothetical protein